MAKATGWDAEVRAEQIATLGTVIVVGIIGFVASSLFSNGLPVQGTFLLIAGGGVLGMQVARIVAMIMGPPRSRGH